MLPACYRQILKKTTRHVTSGWAKLKECKKFQISEMAFHLGTLEEVRKGSSSILGWRTLCLRTYYKQSTRNHLQHNVRFIRGSCQEITSQTLENHYNLRKLMKMALRKPLRRNIDGIQEHDSWLPDQVL